ncbi:MAG: hypothetical protein VX473_03555 [Candidatus Thermoplasmatota archaeon]|nr:hypothetical protein [Candidatus Thermoplasmatota archaeon]
MSGGLLEKAKQVSGDSDDDVSAAANAVIGENTHPLERTGALAELASGGLMAFVGGGLFAISLILIIVMKWLDSIPLIGDFIGYIILILLLISAYLTSLHIKYSMNEGRSITGMQWTTLAVVWLLLSSGVWVTGWEEEGGGILVTDGQIHDDTDTVTLMLRHTSGLFSSSWDGGDVHVEITQHGQETWNGTINVLMNQEDMIGTYGLITLDIEDFYNESAIQIEGFTSSGDVNTVEYPYTVFVTLNGETVSTVLPALPLAREVNDIDDEAYGQVGDTDCPQDYDSCVQFVEIRGYVGLGIESADEDTTPIRVRGDYEIGVSFGLDGDPSSINQPNLAISGTDASWSSGDCSSGSMDNFAEDTSAFRLMCNGDLSYPPEIALSDSSGEREYGCYTLTLTAHQNGEQVATSSSHYMFEHHEETYDADPGPGQDMQTSYWETWSASDENGDPISC